ncbi:hypothetical protein ACE4Z2_25390, partial [Salmonella enterica]
MNRVCQSWLWAFHEGITLDQDSGCDKVRLGGFGSFGACQQPVQDGEGLPGHDVHLLVDDRQGPW